MGSFDLDHQPERYALEIEGKGLVNAGQDLKNQGYQLDNKGKLIQNEILGLQRDIAEFDKSMKSIDAEKHREFVESELKRIASNIFLTISEARALNKKLPYELQILGQTFKKLKSETDESQKRVYAQQLANELEDYLRENGLHNRFLADTDMMNMLGRILQTLSDLDIGFGW